MPTYDDAQQSDQDDSDWVDPRSGSHLFFLSLLQKYSGYICSYSPLGLPCRLTQACNPRGQVAVSWVDTSILLRDTPLRLVAPDETDTYNTHLMR